MDVVLEKSRQVIGVIHDVLSSEYARILGLIVQEQQHNGADIAEALDEIHARVAGNFYITPTEYVRDFLSFTDLLSQSLILPVRTGDGQVADDTDLPVRKRPRHLAKLATHLVHDAYQEDPELVSLSDLRTF